jgi:hypothetical protein
MGCTLLPYRASGQQGLEQKMNEFATLANDLRAAGRIDAASHAERIAAPRETMRVMHPAQAAYGGQAWNGWRFSRVREELKAQRVSSEAGLCIYNAIRELEENDRLGNA